MRIIKTGPNYLNTIAGEMLNIEASTLYFIDGKLVQEPVRGYPTIVDGSESFTIRSTVGYIYLPMGANTNVLLDGLKGALAYLETLLPAPVLQNYHSVEIGTNTNVKVQPKFEQDIPEQEPRFDRRGRRIQAAQQKTLPKRDFVDTTSTKRNRRFTWVITTIDNFDYEIANDNIEEAVARNACSLFYDRDNICKLAHNSTTFEWSKQCLRGSDNIIGEKLSLFAHGHPLAFELSQYWREHVPNASAERFLRNCTVAVRKQSLDKLQLKPVKITDYGTETSTEVCAKCHSLLWGENYVLGGHATDYDNPTCVAFCPICFHSSPEDAPLESRYTLVYAVNFPRTANEIIDMTAPEVADIYKQAVKSVQTCQTVLGGANTSYSLIGDKYAAFASTDTYLYSNAVNMDEFAGRTICKLTMIK